MQTDLNSCIQSLAHIRSQIKTVEAELRQAEDEFEQEFADLRVHLQELKKKELIVYEQVCETALQRFAQTGDLTPDPDVELRYTADLKYDETQLIAWCIQHAPDLLRIEINKRALTTARAEEIASAGAPIVISSQPKPFISQRLSHRLLQESGQTSDV